jgi:hypothetical protein
MMAHRLCALYMDLILYRVLKSASFTFPSKSILMALAKSIVSKKSKQGGKAKSASTSSNKKVGG